MNEIREYYGVGMTGTGFDPRTFFTKPVVMLRLIASLLALLVWVFISNGGWFRTQTGVEVCLFGGGQGACGFGVTIAVLALIVAISFLFLDAFFERISSVQQRKQAIIVDLASSTFFTFFFFVVFVTLWSKYSSLELTEVYDSSSPNGAIFFSFLSIFTWGGIIFFTWKRYQDGAASAFAPSYEQDLGAGFGFGTGADFSFSGGPSVGGTESYQESPFTTRNEPLGIPQYQQQAY